MKKLYINTANNKEVIVSLEIDGKKDTLTKEVGKERTQLVLPLMKALLEKHALSLQDLEGIIVEIGPGSFTGLRVGVTIANTLGLLLGIPINDYPIGKTVEPVYS